MNPRFAPVLFGLMLSGSMSLIVSGVATVRAMGLVDGVVTLWLGSWLFAWAVAFPSVLVLAPIVRRLVVRLVRDGV